MAAVFARLELDRRMGVQSGSWMVLQRIVLAFATVCAFSGPSALPAAVGEAIRIANQACKHTTRRHNTLSFSLKLIVKYMNECPGLLHTERAASSFLHASCKQSMSCKRTPISVTCSSLWIFHVTRFHTGPLLPTQSTQLAVVRRNKSALTASMLFGQMPSAAERSCAVKGERTGGCGAPGIAG